MGKIFCRIGLLVILLAGLVGAFATPAEAATLTVSFAPNYDGDIYKYSLVYEYIWDHTWSGLRRDEADHISVGQDTQVAGNTYYLIYRSALSFDTSTIGSSATVVSAKLKLYGHTDGSTTDFNIQIQSGMPTYPHTPMETSDYNQANYSGNGGTISTSGWADDAYNEITLNATGISWVNTAGATKFMLRSDRDVAGTNPTDHEVVTFASYEAGAGYWPVLEITYSAPVPVIVAKPATNVQFTAAKLNALIDNDTNTDVEVRFGYGTTSHITADFDDYDNVTEWWSGWEEGQTASVTVVGLSPNTIYYYRAQIKNDYDNSTSVDEIAFDTTGQPSALTDYDVSVGGEIISINPDMPGTMFTELDSTYFPGSQIVEDILAQSDTPRALWWYPFIFGFIAIVALLVFGLTMKTGGEGSILVMGIVIEVLLVAFGTLGAVANKSLIPLFPALLMLIPIIAIIISKQSVKIGG